MKKLFLCYVYIPPYYHDKNNTWLSMFNILHNSYQSWVLIRDLNDITSQEDMQGGIPFTYTYKNMLTSFINKTEAINLGSIGMKFT